MTLFDSPIMHCIAQFVVVWTSRFLQIVTGFVFYFSHCRISNLLTEVTCGMMMRQTVVPDKPDRFSFVRLAAGCIAAFC